MNPDDIATETIMPEAFLDLARRMVAQKSPEAAATAALAWALRHAPVDGGCTLEIAGHRIERIAPEPDPWPTDHPLIVASVDDGGPQLLSIITRHAAVTMTSAIVRRAEHTLTNVVPVTVVPVAELEALRASIKALGYETIASPGSLLDTSLRLIDATDALGVDL